MNVGFSNWGPAALVCVTILLGIVFYNSRINDLRSYIDARFNGVDKRFDDLKDFVKREVRRLEERQSPIRRA
jgi:uncharacterized protein (DUF2164 family)